jgi:hypothetical protein
VATTLVSLLPEDRAALVHGSGYKHLTSSSCVERTIRRRDEWAKAGIGCELLRIGLDAYDRMICLKLADLAVDGSNMKPPCGGEVSGRSPMDLENKAPNGPWPATVTESHCIWSPPAPTT